MQVWQVFITYMTYFTALLIHCKAKTKFTHNKNIKRSRINFRIIPLYYFPEIFFPLCERVRAFHQRCLLMKMHLDLELQNSTSTELMAPWGIVFAPLSQGRRNVWGRENRSSPYFERLAYRTRTIIGRSRFEAALVYKPRILGLKNEEFPFLVHKLSVI